MAVGGDATPKVSYVLAELDDMDNVFVPIKTASRVKYTCFDVSRHYFAFGTTTGSIIILQHDSLLYLKTVAGKEGPVCRVSFSPDESMIGFSSSRGVTIVMEHNADRGTTPPQRLQLSYEHKGSMVTALHWNVSSSKLFVGDDRGKVSVISVTTSRARNIFQVPTATLVKLDSKVIQLDFAQNHLLVSTMTRCYLCNTNREQFLQIGKKLRDGEYGACFYPGYKSNEPCTLYCARPGSRMWEVDIKGEVHCTHQFKNALATIPEKLFSFRNEVNMDDTTVDAKPHATAFNKLLLIWPSTEDLPFIFTWGSLATYVFDPKRAQVVLWTEDLKGIKDVKCQRGDVYVHFQDGKFAKFTLMTVEHAVCRLYQQGLAVHSAQLLLLKQASLCAARLNIHVPPSFLLDMLQRVSDLGKTYLFSSLSAVFGRLGLSPDKLSQSSRSSSAMSEPMRLGSGIYVVNRIVRDLDEPSSSVCLSRWRSASPVFRYHSPHSSPTRQSTSLSSPVRRKRSGTMPSVRVKEAPFRTRAVHSAANTTPDSIDSGASGKTSDFSDDTHSSPSSKDFKPIIVGLGTCDNYSLEKKQNLVKLKDSLYQVLAPKQNGHLASTLNGDHLELNSTPQIPPTESREASSNFGQKISLNLSDLSQKNIQTGKRVSFEAKQVPIDSSKSAIENSLSDKVELKCNSELMNGFDSIGKNISYEVAEEATCDIYPDALYEETYSYMNMSLYGMMVPNVDFSLIFGSDKDFQNIKESLANKITTGKNLLKKGLEHIKQSQNLKPELLDVKPKKSMSEMSLSLKLTESETSISENQAGSKLWSFLPPFDNSALVEASKLARSKIRDSGILFNSVNVKTVLEEWVMYLHASQKCIISLVHNFCQSSFSGGTHSKDDDTIRSTGSLVTSGGSTPSGDPSDRLETEEGSISDSKSFDEEKHAESTSSWNTEISESSTLKTESLQRMLSVEDFVFVYDPFRLCKEDHAIVAELATMCFQLKIWGNISNLHEATTLLHNKRTDSSDKSLQDSEKRSSALNSQGTDSNFHLNCPINGEVLFHEIPNSNVGTAFISNPKASSSKEPSISSVPNVPKSSSGSNLDPSSYSSGANFKQSCSVPKINLINADFDSKQHTGDFFSAMFIQNYFHLIDVQRLRELLVIRNEPCILTWNVMLKGVSFLNSKDEFMQKINSGQLDSAANSLERNISGAQLISHLLRLFRAKPSRAIELCLHRSYHVTPLDVLYLSISSNMLPEFLNYVSCVIDCLSETQKPNVLEKLLTLDEVRWAWVCGVLQDLKSSATKCKCGWPRPGSHLYTWQYSELLLHIIKTSTSMMEELLNVCFRSGFWKGYVWLAKKLNYFDIHQQILVHLADVSLLNKNDDLGYLPSTIDDWKRLFSLISQLEQSVGFATCISCGEKHACRTNFHLSLDSSIVWETTLHWEAAAHLALRSLGPINVLALLKGLDIPSGTLSPEFYSSIIQTHLMNKQQSALSHRMLTNVGSYMWSRRPTSFTPELHQLFRKEKKASNTDVSAKCKKETVHESSKYHFEEPESHWGIKMRLRGPCTLCKLPLTSHLTLSASGVIICACGDAYHSVCLPSGTCMACIKFCDEGT